jgi:hypothetical protein
MNAPSRSEAKPQRVPQGHRRNGAITAPNAGVATLAASLMLMAASPAKAIDGCVVLLCLATPSWRGIPQCVPPIRQLFQDLARGKAFPTCGMAGGSSSASHNWSSAPSFCPPQYTRTWDGPNGPIYACDYDGAISVAVNGEHFSRTWWSVSGDAVTDFSPKAKSQLGSWDARYDSEYTAWLSSLPSMPSTPIR